MTSYVEFPATGCVNIIDDDEDWPIVVSIVPAKKSDCPKLQFGSLLTLRAADTPRLLALIMATMNSSKSASANKHNRH